MKLDAHYVDPRLVALYDRDNPRGKDTDFYLALAEETHARRIVDLGCGTGLLTCELASAGRQVIGVDPSAAMLAIAKEKPGAGQVQWVEGTSANMGNQEADLAIMTGNVAQVFLDDTEWDTTLHALFETLRPGGYLAFESRNPEARAWETWVREKTYEQSETAFGSMECWLDLLSVKNGIVHFEGHNIFSDTGEDVVVSSELRFRSQTELTVSLTKAGFRIEHLYGDWHREPFTPTSRLMIFVAQRS